MEDSKVEKKVKALIEQARKTGKKVKAPKLVSGKSSLAQFIRTKEQADELMENLNSAFASVS